MTALRRHLLDGLVQADGFDFKVTFGGALSFGRTFPRELGADSRQRHVEVDGLGDIVVGSEVEALDDVLALALGADHDDGQFYVGVDLAHAPKHFVAAEIRHHDIEQDDIELAGTEFVQRILSPRRLDRIKATPDQTPHQDIAIVGNIVSDKNASFRFDTAGRRRLIPMKYLQCKVCGAHRRSFLVFLK